MPSPGALPAGKPQDAPRGTMAPALGYGLAVLGVALASIVFSMARHALHAAHASLLFLLVVAVVAYVAGSGPAAVSALLSFLSWNYFIIEPVHTFAVHEPRDLIALFVFLVVAVLIGELAARVREQAAGTRVREQAAAAHVRERATNMLYEISKLISADTDAIRVLPKVLDQLVRASHAGGGAVLLVGPRGDLQPAVTTRVDVLDAAGEDWRARAQQVSRTGQPIGLNPLLVRAPVYLPLSGAARVEGVLVIVPGMPRRGLPRQSRRVLLTAASHLGVALERQRLAAAAAQAEALRAAEQFRNTFLSSVSHDLRTPLASIKAAVTSLLHSEHSPEAQRELIQAINEESDRLNAFVGDLLDLSRLDAGAWRPERDWFDVTDLLGTVLGRLDDAAAARVRLHLAPGLPMVPVDCIQMGQALWNLIENALKYSPADSPVSVDVTAGGKAVLRISVSDWGPGIPPGEEERIFEKFYRATGDRRRKGVPGTGLGLAIVRGIIDAHGGRVRAYTRAEGGATFEILLPISPPDMPAPSALADEPAPDGEEYADAR